MRLTYTLLRTGLYFSGKTRESILFLHACSPIPIILGLQFRAFTALTPFCDSSNLRLAKTATASLLLSRDTSLRFSASGTTPVIEDRLGNSGSLLLAFLFPGILTLEALVSTEAHQCFHSQVICVLPSFPNLFSVEGSIITGISTLPRAAV